MLDLHYWTTPNGHKITIFLEETGLAYKIIPVDIGKGEQFKSSSSRLHRTTASRRWSIIGRPAEASRSRCSNRAPF